MKLLLIQPPIEDFYETAARLQPLGLALLKAAVGRYLPEVDVTVRDYHQGRGRHTVPLPPALAYLRDYWVAPDRGPFSTFHQYFRFGADHERIAAEVARERPDLVGISALFTPYYQEALETARAIKRRLPVPIVMGGAHVTAAPESLLSDEAVDYVIRGEGERPLVEFIKTLTGGGPLEAVPNLGFRREDRLVFNPMAENYALDDLPWADLADLPPERYQLAKRPLCFILTSRGCPHHCGFCAVHQTFGRRYRPRTVTDVLGEIETRHKQGFRVVDFEDDNLTVDPERFKRLLLGLIERFPAGGLEFMAMNGVSYDGLNEDLLTLMARAGFTHLNLSLVSASDRTRSLVDRPHTLAKFAAVTSQAQVLGLKMVAYQILGLPGETLEEMVQTMAFLSRLPVVIGPSLFYLTPGSAVAAGFPAPTPDDFVRARGTAMAIETADFRRNDLYTLFITARIINFLKGLAVDGEVRLSEALDAARRSGGRAGLGAELLDRLLGERRLHAATRDGKIPLTRFQPDLFSRVWNKAGFIATPTGQRIGLRDTPPPAK